MLVNRYIIVKAIKDRENKLIPIWDESVTYNKSNYDGECLVVNNREKIHDIVECVYDLKTKTLNFGIEVNIYPDDENILFKKDEIVLYKDPKDFNSDNTLHESEIKEIIYEKFDLLIFKGKKILKDEWLLNKLKKLNITVLPDNIYAIKQWKPFWLLKNDIKIQYNMNLYRLKK
jgi:hypothetical protein